MQIEIVTIGNEVLSGRTLDTNFAFLARALEAVSVQIGWHATVPDDPARIAGALRTALARADAVVMTGGLGPTPDDRTRDAVAGALGLELHPDAEVLEQIRERARRMKRRLPASVESMALVPRGATLWKNPLGTAPGIVLERDGKPVVLLPGVPYEMERLATEFLVPFLERKCGRGVETFTLRTTGIFESALHEKIGALPDGWPGAGLAYLPGLGGVDLRVTVAGEEAREVRQVARRAYDELKAVVAPWVYAEGTRTLEETVGEILAERRLMLATAESCTGGLLAKRLTDTPGSSRYFERGFVTYSNAAKVELLGVRAADLEAHGAVSAPVAEQMARGASERSGVGVGIGITGVAGPDGGTDEKPVGTVFIGVHAPEGDAVRRYHLAGTRNSVRMRSVQAALELLRRRLLGLPLEPPS